MTTINLFDTKEQLLSFRDTVGTVLSDELSTKIRGRRLDELSARLLGASDFNTALGLIERKQSAAEPTVEALKAALIFARQSRDYMSEHGVYPDVMIKMMGDDVCIDDFLADLAEAALAGEPTPILSLGIFDAPIFGDVLKVPSQFLDAGDLTGVKNSYSVSSHLAKHFHRCHGFGELHGHFHAMSFSVPAPSDATGDYLQGWMLADKLAIHGLLNINPNSETPGNLTDAQAYGFWDRQNKQRRLLQADINNFLRAEKSLNIKLIQDKTENLWGWKCTAVGQKSMQTHATRELAYLDGMKELGAFGFCNQNDFRRILRTEGWFFDFFETDEDGLVIQLMGHESVNESTPSLTDEQAWEWVVSKAREGSIIHTKALEWLAKVCEKERKRIREHTGY
jgi:hypothetical protein